MQMERVAKDQHQDRITPLYPDLDDEMEEIEDHPPQRVLPPARPARVKGRHLAVLASFVVCVIFPAFLMQWYLANRAADQFASTVAFTVRTEDTPLGLEVFSFVTAASGGGMSNADILYEFIRSQQLVAQVNAEIDLRRLYSKPTNDPVFAFDPEGSIEDLVAYWVRMVRVSYEPDTGLLEVRALAFTPEDAQLIARTVFAASSEMINGLSTAAQQDATRYAREELDMAVDRLKSARQALTRFRSEHQLVDPNADLTGQMGILNSLQQQMAEALIEFDLLRDVTRANDPRVGQAQRRITAIKARIEEEKQKLSSGTADPGDRTFTQIVGRFEELTVDREFAEQSYLGARASFDAAVAEARRKSIYLAAYIEPTLAETARYPDRSLILGLGALFLGLIWAIGTLIFYSVRDRR